MKINEVADRNADILDADQIVRTAECVAAAGNNSVILVVTLLFV